MVKRLLLIIFFIFLSATFMFGFSLSVTPKIGLNLSYADYDPEITYNSLIFDDAYHWFRFGLNGGVGVDMYFAKLNKFDVGIGVDMLYSEEGDSIVYLYSSGDKLTYVDKFDVFNIPIMFKGKYTDKGNKYILGGGLQFGSLLSAKQVTEDDENPDNNSTTDVKDSVASSITSFVIVGGVQLSNSFLIEVKYVYGLTDLAVSTDDLTVKGKCVTISVGYSIDLIK